MEPEESETPALPILQGRQVEMPPPGFDFNLLRTEALEILQKNTLQVWVNILAGLRFVREDNMELCPSAQIRNTKKGPLIEYNGPFVWTFARTPMDFACLLGHELLHHALGHLRKTYDADQLTVNIAQDAVINMILDGLSSPEFPLTDFLKNYYSLEKNPDALLCPPALDSAVATQQLREMSERDYSLAQMWRTLHWYGSATEWDVIRWLESEYPPEEGEQPNPPLLGRHKPPKDKSKGDPPPDSLEEQSPGNPSDQGENSASKDPSQGTPTPSKSPAEEKQKPAEDKEDEDASDGEESKDEEEEKEDQDESNGDGEETDGDSEEKDDTEESGNGDSDGEEEESEDDDSDSEDAEDPSEEEDEEDSNIPLEVFEDLIEDLEVRGKRDPFAKPQDKTPQPKEESGEPTSANPEGDENALDQSQAVSVLEACVGQGSGGNRYVRAVLGEIRPEPFPPELKQRLIREGLQRLQRDVVSAILGPCLAPGKVLQPEYLTPEDIMQMAGGGWPVFFNQEVPKAAPPVCSAFIDVSGSMSVFYNWMYGVILGLSEEAVVDPWIWSSSYSGFSGIKRISMDVIRAGQVTTGGGTEVDLVLEKILELQDEIRSAVIFSDGDFTATDKLAKRVFECPVQVFGVLFQSREDSKNNAYYRAKMESVCEEVFIVPASICEYERDE